MRVWLVSVAMVAVAACSGGGQGSGSAAAPNPTAPDTGTAATPPSPDAGTPPDAGIIGAGSTPDAGTGFAITEIPQVIGASGGTFVPEPAGINSLGQVVGGFNDCVSVGLSECAGGPLSGFIFDPAKGTTTRISAAGTENHTAVAINDAGAIILNGNPRGPYDGLVLVNGTVIHLGDDASVDGINQQGFVTGSTEMPDGNVIAYLWDGATLSTIGPPAASAAA